MSVDFPRFTPAPTPELVAESIVLTGRIDTVESLAFSPDGKTIAVGGDGTVRLWPTAKH
ncbi:WD40 repeat domain-containing protein [Planobispora rosea]|uniref:WD40 repeat domain-containing protein n=1 Tax=Planobispora rosea TaxID=35762 RepID=UPI00159F2DB5|nr:WD40 repeat domain-containing protein [Planobispora rosea]